MPRELPVDRRDAADGIVPGITEGMLSARLQELHEGGIVERGVLPGPPVATVYRLTERGLALEPALLELARWAQSNL